MRSPFPLWPLPILLALAVFQLVPLPPSIHSVLAPGSYAIWHPLEPTAAAVLGYTWRPISVVPEATRRWLGLTTGLVALAVLAAPALRDRHRAFRATLVVGIGGLAVALYGIVARTLFGSLLYGRIVVPTVAPFGPFVSKNHFAGFVEMAALLTLGLATGLADEARRSSSILGWIESRRAGRVVLAYGVAGTMTLAVLVSLSRGGVVSLAAGVVVFMALRLWVHHRTPEIGRSLGMFGVLVIVALASFTVLPPEGKVRILSLAGITSDLSGTFRLGIWRDTVRLVGSSPIVGQGFGAYEDALPRFKTTAGRLRIQHAENDYLELLAEGGALGLLLCGMLLVVTSRFMMSGFRSQPDRLLRGLGLGAAAGLAALLLHSSFDFNLRIPSNALLFAFLAAVAMATAGPWRAEALGHHAWWGVVLILLVALMGAAMPASPRPSWEALGVIEASSALRRQRAEDLLVDHLSRRPSDAEAWLLLGWLRTARGARREGTALTRYAAALDPLRELLPGVDPAPHYNNEAGSDVGKATRP